MAEWLERSAAPLHELESEVMEELWEHEERTVRGVLDSLNGRSEKQRAYTTVMTTMQRLCEKGLLSRRREGKTDLYLARFTRDEYAQARARSQVSDLVDQYGEAALVHFAREMGRLDPARRRRLERLSRKR